MRPIHSRRSPVWAVRRAIAPASLEMPGVVTELRAELQRLRDDVELLRAEDDRLRQALDEREAEVAGLRRELADRQAAHEELREGLHEARRLNLRVAEVTDLVTELVLPLHDRDVDPAALRRLRGDTL